MKKFKFGEKKLNKKERDLEQDPKKGKCLNRVKWPFELFQVGGCARIANFKYDSYRKMEIKVETTNELNWRGSHRSESDDENGEGHSNGCRSFCEWANRTT